MALFTAASVERVKEASDIVEVISAHTELRRSGVRYTGLCPFHDERSPSFSVDPTDKLYHCFGCGVGGDVIKFVEEKEGLAFPDAVEALADRYGVEIERESEDPRAEEQRRKRARLTELLERTAGFYATFLSGCAAGGEGARLPGVGEGSGTRRSREFGVGCAPGTWDTVLIRGQQAGYSIEEIEAAGLVLKSQKGRGHYDRFRSRIMFPIRDARGRMQGFGGAGAAPDQRPKYVNSPEGELYRSGARCTGSSARGRRSRRRAGGRGRGLHGRDRAAPGGDRASGRDDGHGDHARAGEAALGVRRGGGAGARRRPRRARGDAARAAGGGASGCGCGWRGCRRARTRPTCLRAATGRARPRFATRSRPRRTCRSSTSTRCSTTADLSSPAGRDRALDEVVAGDRRDARLDHARGADARGRPNRLDADPGLVARRARGGRAWAGAGGARRPRRPRGGGRAAGRAADAAALSSRERRELALLAMCVRLPAEGREVLERLTDEHFSRPVAARARVWLARPPRATRWRGCSRDDEELLALRHRRRRCAPRRSPPAPRRWSSACSSSRRSRSSTTRSRRPRPTAAAPHRSTCSAAARSSRSGSRGRSRSLGSVAESEQMFAFPSGRAGILRAWTEIGSRVGFRVGSP